MKSQNKASFTRKIFLKTISLILFYTLLYVLTFYLFYLLTSIRLWEKNDIIYIVLNFFKRNILIFWLIGILVIIAYYWNRVIKYISKIENETQKVVYDENALVNLPKDLKSIESSVNYVKEESLKNRNLVISEQQKRNELIASLAHDLKTPLTSIIGYLELILQRDDLSEENKVKYLNIIMNKSISLENLINELFELSKYNINEIDLKFEKIIIDDFLARIIQDFYPLLISENKKIEFNNNNNNNQIFINGDVEKLTRMFNNLIKNAINYSLPNSTIIIGYSVNKNSITITIKNECKQLTEEELSRIFDRFYRCDTSRNSEKGGSGLGLTIAKDIIIMHKGNINVNQNNGTITFNITLPILIKS